MADRRVLDPFAAPPAKPVKARRAREATVPVETPEPVDTPAEPEVPTDA